MRLHVRILRRSNIQNLRATEGFLRSFTLGPHKISRGARELVRTPSYHKKKKKEKNKRNLVFSRLSYEDEKLGTKLVMLYCLDVTKVTKKFFCLFVDKFMCICDCVGIPIFQFPPFSC